MALLGLKNQGPEWCSKDSPIQGFLRPTWDFMWGVTTLFEHVGSCKSVGGGSFSFSSFWGLPGWSMGHVGEPGMLVMSSLEGIERSTLRKTNVPVRLKGSPSGFHVCFPECDQGRSQVSDVHASFLCSSRKHTHPIPKRISKTPTTVDSNDKYITSTYQVHHLLQLISVND